MVSVLFLIMGNTLIIFQTDKILVPKKPKTQIIAQIRSDQTDEEKEVEKE